MNESFRATIGFAILAIVLSFTANLAGCIVARGMAYVGGVVFAMLAAGISYVAQHFYTLEAARSEYGHLRGAEFMATVAGACQFAAAGCVLFAIGLFAAGSWPE